MEARLKEIQPERRGEAEADAQPNCFTCATPRSQFRPPDHLTPWIFSKTRHIAQVATSEALLRSARWSCYSASQRLVGLIFETYLAGM